MFSLYLCHGTVTFYSRILPEYQNIASEKGSDAKVLCAVNAVQIQFSHEKCNKREELAKDKQWKESEENIHLQKEICERSGKPDG